MNQRVHFTTHTLLKTVVACIGYVEICADDVVDGWFGLCPNGTTNITISLNDANLEYFTTTGKCILYAPPFSREGIKISRQLKFINLQLKPFGFFPLLGIPMPEFKNQAISLDTVFPSSECEFLIDQLRATNVINDKFLLIEKFLLDKIRPNFMDSRVMHAARIMKSRSIGMDELSSEVCLSNRRFRELFSLHTGFSPNTFKKLMRFNRATQQLSRLINPSLTEVAIDYDYFDQSHFIKDFKLFSGITPSEFIKLKATSADFYNYRIPQ